MLTTTLALDGTLAADGSGPATPLRSDGTAPGNQAPYPTSERIWDAKTIANITPTAVR